MKSHPYRAEDFLLRIGLGLLVLVIVSAMAFRPWEGRDPRPNKGAYLVSVIDEDGRFFEVRAYVWDGIKTEEERIANLEGRYPNALHIRKMPPWRLSLTSSEKFFLTAALAPIAMLIVGYVIRRREQRLLSIIKLLRHNIETNVGDLLANSDYSREEIEKSVREINERGLGLYAWRRDTDVIEDGRLNGAYLHVDRCDSCGASVGLRIPASLREIPTCPYCHTAQSSNHLNALKLDVIRELREHTPVTGATAAQKPMSIGLFIFLIILCWPAAIAYAIYKSSVAQRIA